MFIWPEGLEKLETFLRARGADTTAFKSARQTAWTAQQLLNTRVKFPAAGEDFYPTLRKIQEAIPEDRNVPSAAMQSTDIPKKSKPSRPALFRGEKPQREPFNEEQIKFGVHLFCDGACEPNPGAGGWGFVVYRNGDERHVETGGSVQTTNNAMELTGMLQAIDHGVRLWDEPVSIWCDSQYVVNGCNDWRHKWKAKGWKRKGDKADSKNSAIANLDLWKAIDQLLSGPRGVQITVQWVKGHNGTVGNERADELSMMGRQQAIAIAVEPPDTPTAEYGEVMGAT